MSNHYYADGAVHHDNHKELNINGNISTEQLMQIATSFLSDEVGESTNQQNIVRGPHKQFLFTTEKSTVENVIVRKTEKERFMRFLSDHNMGNSKLDTYKNSRLNLVVVCFLKIWHEKDLVSKSPSGGAIFRFLTEDCNLSTLVTKDSYANKIKKWIDDNDYDMNIYIDVRKCF